ncbi:isoprenyl transferase [Granulicatella sp. zg-ZJ]|uniref:isoprenyl transferase n=1 Tax=unclassified Granulicatella TaxID=2630493 RepID=UPI0013C1ED72|nr:MULTISPECIES: isoprenyl transferase [unclassified Granulicatella]MBS4750894.1 isoprenyl transferase [Carnobacteriaceae bacterium zg-ZUI78]NEW62761.1 isoprenyl transferase [Granulicatella sp. zg-ZJ]NEW65539.1 isoprenyl transferase [Granulicatella sp. zg-84]QMI85578.1 isoprenyl transferase [Carnobacteriaceae bacterium zg-84]
MFFFKKKQNNEEKISFDEKQGVPNHVAIIMDGNGRWAQQRMLPRVAGHKEGMQTVKTIALHAKKLGVKVLSLYAFSTENWKRPHDEVSFLMKLPIDFFSTFIPQLNENNIRVMTTGFIEQLPEKTQKAVLDAVEQTKQNDGMILNFALNYGSRAEIIAAIKKISIEYHDKVEEINEEIVSDYLWSKQLGEYAEPDLLIRTSGEERISNFMLWQIAYSEFYFTDVFWPDFKEQELEKAFAIYQKRHRRFGGL